MEVIVEVALAPSDVYMHAYMEIACRYRHTCRPRSYSSIPVPSARVVQDAKQRGNKKVKGRCMVISLVRLWDQPVDQGW